MKKGIVVLLALFVVGSLCAQGMGLKGGLNIANLTGDDVEDADAKMGFVIGGFYNHQINEMFSVQPELLFTMKGAKYESKERDEDEDGWEYYDKGEGSWNLSYLEIPVLAKVNIPMEGNFKPNVFFGPALGFNISATYDTDYEYWVKDENGDIIYEESGSDDGDIEDIKGMDFGLVFGAGADIGKFTVDARFTMGLTTIFDVEGDTDVKNSVMSILFGYKFK